MDPIRIAGYMNFFGFRVSLSEHVLRSIARQGVLKMKGVL